MDRIDLCENRVTKKGRRAMSLIPRLSKSKNFRKMDRSLEDYIDRNPELKLTDKCVLKKLLLLRGRDDAIEVKATHSGLAKQLSVDRRTVASSLRKLVVKGFLTYVEDEYEDGCNYAKKVYRFPETFPGFDPAEVAIRRGDAKKLKARKARAAALDSRGLRPRDMNRIHEVERKSDLTVEKRDEILASEYQRLATLGMKRMQR